MQHLQSVDVFAVESTGFEGFHEKGWGSDICWCTSWTQEWRVGWWLVLWLNYELL